MTGYVVLFNIILFSNIVTYNSNIYVWDWPNILHTSFSVKNLKKIFTDPTLKSTFELMVI